MLFNSLAFVFFLAIALVVFGFTPKRSRWIVLLAASYVFIAMARVEYALIIATVTFINFIAAVFIYKRRSTVIYVLTLIINILALVAFKYLNFFSSATRDLLMLFDIPFEAKVLQIILPLGISYFTFQNISYLTEVHRRKIKPERHLGIFALFIAFFPKVISGPIERPTLISQFKKNKRDAALTAEGVRLIVFGFFKKLVIADGIAFAVNTIYDDPTQFSGIPLLLGTVLFALQLYYDFSGYTDVALGVAALFGIRLTQNFNRPYFAKSISDFWSRWHISLSSWLRDYLYFPLGGNRVTFLRWCANIMVVFLISGLWHGAAWTFIIWGALHGVYTISSRITGKIRENISSRIAPRLHEIFQVIFTFCIVCFAWIFFRANHVADAIYIITHLFTFKDFLGVNLGVTQLTLAVLGSMVFICEVIQYAMSQKWWEKFALQRPIAMWSIVILLSLLTIVFGTYRETSFIYAQF